MTTPHLSDFPARRKITWVFAQSAEQVFAQRENLGF
jgi:hypothetical protein